MLGPLLGTLGCLPGADPSPAGTLAAPAQWPEGFLPVGVREVCLVLQPRLQPESSDTQFGSWLVPWGVRVDVRAPDGCRTGRLSHRRLPTTGGLSGVSPGQWGFGSCSDLAERGKVKNKRPGELQSTGWRDGMEASEDLAGQWRAGARARSVPPPQRLGLEGWSPPNRCLRSI